MSIQVSPTPDAVKASAPTEAYQVTGKRESHSQRRLALAALALVIFSTSFFLNGFRIYENTDLRSDEATYVIESVSFHQTGVTRWNGGPFFVHPPLFYMIEGLYFKALGIGESPLFDRLVSDSYRTGEALLPPDAPLNWDNMVNAIMVGRLLSTFYGALIAVLLLFLGAALLNRTAGALAAMLFMLDPYVIWRNHFNYLEPLATLMATLMVMAYWSALNKPTVRERRWRLLSTGILLGLALFSKELALLYIPAFAVHALLFKRVSIRELVAPMLTAFAVYAIFPFWAALSGSFDSWLITKSWLFSRLTGAIQDTGITRPGAPVVRTLNTNLLDYWPWFVLLGLAGLFALLFLFLYFKNKLRDPAAEMLTSFIIGCYGFFIGVRLMGGVINEQFFYMLMPFPPLAVAYGIKAWPRLRALAATHTARNEVAREAWSQADGGRLRFDGSSGHGSVRTAPVADPLSTLRLSTVPTPRHSPRIMQALLAMLLLLSIYNIGAWVLRYGLGYDNSYVQAEGFLAERMRPGEDVIGRDLLDLYLLPTNDVYTFSYLDLEGKQIDPTNVLDRQIPYVILNEQSVIERYGGANPIYYDWVNTYGDELYKFQGRRWATSVHAINYERLAVAKLAEDSIAVGKPVQASSFETTGGVRGTSFRPESAFDALATTRWASLEADNQWIYVDLGESRDIGRVVLHWEDAYAQEYELQVSDNATDWTTFYRTTDGNGSLEEIEAQGRGRYVRLLLTRRATEFGFSLWEIAIYP